MIREDMIERFRCAVNAAFADIVKNDTLHVSCISCVHFRHKEEVCNLYKQRPPAKVIAAGCPQYMDNLGVPF